jgi:hypothetical protein
MNRDEVLARAVEFVDGCGVQAGLRSSTVMEVASEVLAALRSPADPVGEPLDEREFTSYLRSQLLWWRLQDTSA